VARCRILTLKKRRREDLEKILKEISFEVIENYGKS